MAVSLDGSAPTDFKHAAEIAKNMALTLKRDWIENPKFFLNINVPDISAEKIKGFKVTKLGIREYVNWFEPKDIGEGTGEVIEVFYGGTQRAIPKEDHESIDNDDVIGGADGPTSIAVISRWENGLATGLAVAAIVLLAAGAVIYFKKRR